MKVKSLSHVRLVGTPWTVAGQASLSITNSRSLLKLMSIELVMPSNHLILCHPLLHPPSIFPTIKVFANESVLGIRWPKYWTFIFSIGPFNKHSGLISFRMDWLDLFAVQGVAESQTRPSDFLLSLSTFMHWRRKWQPTPVILPGESQGWGSLVGCRLWGHTELDTTKAT